MAINSQKLKLIVIFLSSLCVNSDGWLTCQQTFCGRIRDRPEKEWTSTRLDFGKGALKLDEKFVETNLNINGTFLKFKLEVIADSFHVLIDEQSGNRYNATGALLSNLTPLNIKAVQTTNDMVTVTYGDNTAKIYREPFSIDFLHNGTIVSTANWNNSIIFKTTDNEVEIAMDILFPDVQRAYGIPEHADHLTLRNTRLGSEPYRLFNVDYGSYDIHSTKALYGSIPVLYAHGVNQSSGIFWLNAAQTWVDVTTSPDNVDAYFMSENGALNFFILMGPTLPQAVKQYTKLTGTAPLPQYFTLGYHQSRYSYASQEEVVSIVEEFDKSKFPVDVMWLDIDYTDEKKYFTWDPKRFKEPEKLLEDLKKTNRKLVAIIDPHFKSDPNYDIDKEAKTKNYYVKEPIKDGGEKDYIAKCWPGDSSWIDFLNPAARNYYSSLYKRKGFNHPNIHIWNDMNEPAVFNDNPRYDKTMPPNLIHTTENNQKRKHQAVHNIYGFYQTMGTRAGLLENKHNLRPFILTRSHFAGIQRYAAIWTGDNVADWHNLQISIPMCLTEALAGVSFCGADVGGFSGIPDDELYQRWYQVGAWLPFFRGHSTINVPRREPYLYPHTIQNRVRAAFHQRYAHLPLWYTLFREHEQTGEPVIRPFVYHYPQDVDALSIDEAFLVGRDVLVAPVLESGVSSMDVYLPGGANETWYNIDDNFKEFMGLGYHTINVNLNSTPVFYRAGSIIPRRDTIRQTVVETYKDPFTLYICLNNISEATGTLYIDDYETFDYQNNTKFVHHTFKFKKNALSSQVNRGNAFTPASKIQHLIILNPPMKMTQAKYTADKESATSKSLQYNIGGNYLNVSGISITLQNDFKIELFNNATILKLSSWMLVAIVISFMLR